MPVLLFATAALGLAVGSFLNVVAHRVPRSLSLVHPASRCPVCAHPIRRRHTVPVLGWLLLRGRCADCATPISVRYPAVELLTAVLFVAVTVRLVDLDLASAIPAFLCFVGLGVALALIDLDVRRLPDSITLPAYPVLAVLLTGAALYSGETAGLLRAVAGAAVSFGFYYLLALTKAGAMGFGDVKAAGLIGGMLAYLSFPVLLVGTALAFALGAAVGLSALARRPRRRTLTSSVPFAPLMLTGALIAVFAGDPLADLYRQLLVPA